jgi:hypothetical protein
MIAGMTDGTIDGNAEKSIGVFATDLIGDGWTPAGAIAPTSMTTESIGTAAATTVKGSAEAIFKPFVSFVSIDGNLRIASRSRNKKPPVEKPAAF